MVADAREDLADSDGVDLTDARDIARDFAALHPKRFFYGELLDEEPGTVQATPKPTSGADQPRLPEFDPDAM
jgi:hypothetical protein